VAWSYDKDGSISSGQDHAWLDGMDYRPIVISPLILLLDDVPSAPP
jgi:hypothetical protein